jgi:Domain of unknown function (DUF5606)
MLKGILSISGHSGLFKMIAEAKNNIVVESLDTGKRMPVYSTTKVSALEDIAIFTENEDMPLKDLFKAIYNKENGGATLSVKSADKELKAYFQSVLPEYDKERVYTSDIKKVLMWYNKLQEKNMLDFSEAVAEAPEDKEENSGN